MKNAGKTRPLGARLPLRTARKKNAQAWRRICLGPCESIARGDAVAAALDGVGEVEALHGEGAAGDVDGGHAEAGGGEVGREVAILDGS